MTAKQLASERIACGVGRKRESEQVESPTWFKDANRIQDSISSGPERKVLVWLARRVPSWIDSDHLTFL